MKKSQNSFIMEFHIVSLLVFALMVGSSMQDSVSATDAKSKVGTYFDKGCSGLVADLLGKPFKLASSYTRGESIGNNGVYTNVKAGDIIGFQGHVGVYIGENKCQFVDVQGPKKNARCINSYGPTEVYKYSY